MRFDQTTLFDMPEARHESPPLVKVPDEVYEVSLRFHLDGQTGEMAASVQVKSALTDELMSWEMTHSPSAEQDVASWVQARVERLRHKLEEYRCPF